MREDAISAEPDRSSQGDLFATSEPEVPKIGRYLPWIEHVDNELFETPVEPNSSGVTRQICTLAVETRSSWTFSELFPGIAIHAPARMFATSVRLCNVLEREGISDFAGIAALSLREAIGFRNMGAKSIDELLGYLIEMALRAPMPTDYKSEDFSPRNTGAPAMPADTEMDHSNILRSLGPDLEIISRWNIARGFAATSLFELRFDEEGTPPHVIDAFRRIHALTASDWVVENGNDESMSSLLDGLISELGEKEREILSRRIATTHPDTLDALGIGFGVTRERVRQIEAKLRPRIQNWLDPNSALGMQAAALRQRIYPVAHRIEVLQDIPSVDGRVLDSDLPAWLFLDKIDDEFESNGEWLAMPSLDVVQAETQLRFEQISGPHSSVSSEQLFEVLLPWTGLSEARLSEWLEYSGYLRVRDGWALLGRRSLPNYVAAYLEQSGAGMAIDEINRAIPWDHSLSSLRNALAEDDRFISVARGEWELRSWGGTEYSGIKAAISSAITTNQGVVALEALISDLVLRLNVSENSVRTYASGWPFVAEKGLVRFATERKSRPRAPGLTRNVYMGDGQVRFRIRINFDHLRGSGSPLPSGLAAALGMVPGERRQYVGPLGTVGVAWSGTQPQLNSIRQILVSLDSSVDDQVILAWADESVGAWKVAEADGNPMAELMALTGIRRDIEANSTDVVALHEIATSLELPANSGWDEVEERTSMRNETDLLELVARARVANPSYEDVQVKSALAIDRVLTRLESMTWNENEKLIARVENHNSSYSDPDWDSAEAALLAVIEKTGQTDQFEQLAAKASALSYGDRSRDAARNVLGALLAMRFMSESGFSPTRFNLLTIEWRSAMGELFD